MRRHRVLVVAMIAGVVFVLGGASSGAQTGRTAGAKATPTAKASETKAALLDVNTASKAELTALPGIGEAYSRRSSTAGLCSGGPARLQEDRPAPPRQDQDQIVAKSEKVNRDVSRPTTRRRIRQRCANRRGLVCTSSALVAHEHADSHGGAPLPFRRATPACPPVERHR